MAVSCDIVLFFRDQCFESSSSAVYPPPQTAFPSGENQSAAQSLTWAVEAEPGGGLVEKVTGAEVTYLY
jgi:hypothetical protein